MKMDAGTWMHVPGSYNTVVNYMSKTFNGNT